MRHVLLRTTLLLSLALLAAPAHAAGLAAIRSVDGTVSSGAFGGAVVVVGDMDGDGAPEFAVAASDDSVPGPGAGRVFVFRGGSAHLGEPPALVISGLPGDFLGSTLAPAGDQDGDGLADLLIGAPAGSDLTPDATGRVLLVYGSSPLGQRTPLVITGDDPDDNFGSAIANLGAFDGDTKPDFAIGAPGSSFEQGYVRVFHGGVTPPTPLFTIHGSDYGDEFGAAVAGVGKTRGATSTNDLLVGAPFASEVQFFGGAATLYFGGSPPDTFPDQTWTGGADDEFGTSVAGIGDFNGDGRTDWVVGAPWVDLGPNPAAGRGYLYLGAVAPPASAALLINGGVAQGNMGAWVSGIGDVNGDGRADFAIAQSGSPDATVPGEVRVFFGKTPPTSVADATLTAEELGDGFGEAISNGGRIVPGNRDLFLIGANSHGDGGRVYLFGYSFPVDAPIEGPAPGATARLLPPWPNPGRTSVRLALEVPTAQRVSLCVVDPAGRAVATLADGELSPGRREFPLRTGTGTPLGPGLYWAVLTTESGRRSAPFVVLGR